MKPTFRLPLASAAVAVVFAGAAAAQQYPSKPIRVINAFAAGTASDIIPRFVLEKAGTFLGPNTSFVFENVPGAGGNPGTLQLIRQDPDGYKIGATAIGPLSVNKTLFKNLGYDPETDIEPITPTAQLSNVVAVSNKSGLTTLKALIDFAKANPDKLTYSSVGPGSSQHLAGVLFEQMTGSTMRHLPYRVTGQLVTDLVTGEVPLSFQNITNVREQFVGGNLKILAITANARHPSIPNVPTSAEAGLPGFVTSAWFCIIAPKGTPKAIVDRLNGAIVKALGEPDIRKRLGEIGAEPMPMKPEEFRKFISDEVVRWRDIIKKGNIQQM